MHLAIADVDIQAKSLNFSKRRWLSATSAAMFALCAGSFSAARADSTNAVYHGHDLGLSLKDALAQVQGTGGSRAAHVNLSISGSGDQLMFTEVNFDTIETETASYKDLEFSDVDVRKVGDTEGRYGVTLHAAAGTVNDHIVGTGAGKSAAPDRDSALGYMDFWLVDPGLTRVHHLADLLATIGARVKEQGSPAAAPSVMADAGAAAAGAIATHAQAAADELEKMPVVLPAPRIPVIEAVAPAAADDDDAVAEPASHGKCLFQADKKSKHARAHAVPASWSGMKQGMVSGSGRLFYKISAVHGADEHQSIQFYLGNTLPVAATVVARVILTASDGSQQSEDIGLNQLESRATKTDDSLQITPFETSACITDVDVTEVHACPLPDDNAEREDQVDIFRCNADAAAGTTKVNGITYVSGREPKSLALPQPAQARSTLSAATPVALTKAVN
jgi:hypothetical protein